MQNFMKFEILQGKSLNPPLYLQEPLKYTHVTLRLVLTHNLWDEVASAERLLESGGLYKDCTVSMHYQEMSQCRNISAKKHHQHKQMCKHTRCAFYKENRQWRQERKEEPQ